MMSSHAGYAADADCGADETVIKQLQRMSALADECCGPDVDARPDMSELLRRLSV